MGQSMKRGVGGDIKNINNVYTITIYKIKICVSSQSPYLFSIPLQLHCSLFSPLRAVHVGVARSHVGVALTYSVTQASTAC